MPELVCDFCGKVFYKPASRAKRSKTGIHYCCLTHRYQKWTKEE